MIEYNSSIKKFNSFSINSFSKYLIKIYKINDFIYYFNFFKKNKIPMLIIGNGTNTIFYRNFEGALLLNRIYGINIKECKYYWYLEVKSGENWNDLVLFTIKNKILGLENLAMIPGRVGAAPICNIGAYGLEIKDICEYVDILNLNNDKIIRLNNKQCKFKYRSSILKFLCKKNFVVINLGLKLLKKWKPVLSHFILKNKNLKNSEEIFNFICNTRSNQIPNYNKIGNSGSFFKNPIISKIKANSLISKYEDIPFYKISKYKIKIPAGWLIDKCNLKGFNICNTSVYNKNSSILINLEKSKDNDIIFLIKFIYYKVFVKFNIKLDLEVSIIYNNKEIKLNNFIFN